MWKSIRPHRPCRLRPADVPCELLGVAAFVWEGLSEVPDTEDASTDVPGLMDVSFDVAPSDFVFIPIPLVLKLLPPPSSAVFEQS